MYSTDLTFLQYSTDIISTDIRTDISTDKVSRVIFNLNQRQRSVLLEGIDPIYICICICICIYFYICVTCTVQRSTGTSTSHLTRWSSRVRMWLTMGEIQWMMAEDPVLVYAGKSIVLYCIIVLYDTTRSY